MRLSSLAIFALLSCSPKLLAEDLFDLSLDQLVNIEITSASLSRESLAQTPVPVTVITQTMIEQASARTVKDLLLTYVPNFTHVTDQNESNIAARGVFTSSQQKILFMIDGHRINSRSYSMASPDYAISLDKIKQIEVLRGPSSSIYGNVALTATVNIKLKQGHELESTKLTVSAGNFDQKQLNILHGKQYQTLDTLVWAQYFSSEGDKQYLDVEDIYSANPVEGAYALVDGYDNKPSYDVGAKLEHQQWQLFLNARQSHYIEPFSGGGLTGEAYQYHNYPQYENSSPGFGYRAQHINLKHQSSLGRWQWHQEVYADFNQFESMVVIDPSTQLSGAPFWKEKSFGGLTHLSLEQNQLSYLLGLQVDTMQVYDGSFKLFQQNTTPISQAPLLEDGKENIYSLFGQIKYQINHQWLAHFGARFDRKDRHKSDDINDLSPRIALIYSPDSQFNIKASYATSFVDATYWNRFSQLSSFRGANSLKPEKLSSFQITPSWHLLERQFYFAANFFYNQLDDFIFRDNSAGFNEPNYSNAGKLTSWGLELESRYQYRSISWHAILGYQHVIDSEKFAITRNDINNVPSLSASLITSWALSDNATASLTTRYISEQYSPINIQTNGVSITDPYPDQGVDFYDLDNQVDDVFLLDSKISYQASDNIATSIMIHNLLDTEYQQGGTSLHPYPQAGRAIKVSISYQF